MINGRMHADELDLDEKLVHELLSEQFPEWASLTITPFPSSGTVNAIYRLGETLYVRLPRMAKWAGTLKQELHWLPIFAPQLSVSIPEPLAEGKAGKKFPAAWAVYRWLAGEPFARGHLRDERQTAEHLAQFVTELRRIDTTAAPRSTRDRPLRFRDREMRAAILASQAVIDAKGVTEAWQLSLQAVEWDGPEVWTHGDLLPPNLILEHGELTAVIDFGNMGVGDPAVDVIAAWSVFAEVGRQAYRSALNVDQETWLRGRGMALHQALLIIPYYEKTNPAFVQMAKRTVAEVLADYRANG